MERIVNSAGAIGAWLGLLAVAIGAFAAHALRSRLPAADQAIVETAVRYQMYHALALVVVALLQRTNPPAAMQRWLGRAAFTFAVGTVIFSGSLYALVGTQVRSLGMVTPIGGVALLGGWLSLAMALKRPKSA